MGATLETWGLFSQPSASAQPALRWIGAASELEEPASAKRQKPQENDLFPAVLGQTKSPPEPVSSFWGRSRRHKAGRELPTLFCALLSFVSIIVGQTGASQMLPRDYAHPLCLLA